MVKEVNASRKQLFELHVLAGVYQKRIVEFLADTVEEWMRAGSGRTKADLAKKIGKDPAYLSRVLSGSNLNITMETFTLLLAGMDARPEIGKTWREPQVAGSVANLVFVDRQKVEPITSVQFKSAVRLCYYTPVSENMSPVRSDTAADSEGGISSILSGSLFDGSGVTAEARIH